MVVTSSSEPCRAASPGPSVRRVAAARSPISGVGRSPRGPSWPHDLDRTRTAPEPPPLPEGPLVGEDRPILEAFLADQRHALLELCAGLTGEQLAERAVPPSNLSLLGLVRHLAKVERIWLRQRVAGEDVGPLFDPVDGKDADFDQLDPARAEADLARHAEECRAGDEAVAALPFEHIFELHGQAFSLRLVYVHLIAEYARHNGHGDLLRERLLARTGA